MPQRSTGPQRRGPRGHPPRAEPCPHEASRQHELGVLRAKIKQIQRVWGRGRAVRPGWGGAALARICVDRAPPLVVSGSGGDPHCMSRFCRQLGVGCPRRSAGARPGAAASPRPPARARAVGSPSGTALGRACGAHERHKQAHHTERGGAAPTYLGRAGQSHGGAGPAAWAPIGRAWTRRRAAAARRSLELNTPSAGSKGTQPRMTIPGSRGDGAGGGAPFPGARPPPRPLSPAQPRCRGKPGIMPKPVVSSPSECRQQSPPGWAVSRGTAPNACRTPSPQVIDARGHMLGRLASLVAKQAMAGHQIVSWALGGLQALRGARVKRLPRRSRRWWCARRRSPSAGASCASG
jgi:hypothetical protein